MYNLSIWDHCLEAWPTFYWASVHGQYTDIFLKNLLVQFRIPSMMVNYLGSEVQRRLKSWYCHYYDSQINFLCYNIVFAKQCFSIKPKGFTVCWPHLSIKLSFNRPLAYLCGLLQIVDEVSSNVSFIFYISPLYELWQLSTYPESCSLNKTGPSILTLDYHPMDWNTWLIILEVHILYLF